MTVGLREVSLGRLFRRRKVLGYVDEPMLSVFREHGVVLKDSLTNHNQTAEDRSIYQLVEPGWLAVNRMKAWQGSLGISGVRGIVSGHYICFEPLHEEHGRFLHYLLRSPKMTTHLAAISRGVRPGQVEIDNDHLVATVLPLPPVEEQRRIADFLDDRVSRIDRIIAARREQLALHLKAHASERDQLIISGSAAAVPLRRFNVMVQTGPFGSQLHQEEYVDGGWPVVNPASILDGRLVPVPGVSVSTAVRDRLSRHRLVPDDIIFGRRGELGRAGLVTKNESGWLCGTGSLLVRLRDERVRPHFVSQLLGTTEVRHFFQLQSVGSTMDNLNTDILLSTPLRVPPVDVQDSLLREVAALNARHDEVRLLMAGSIDLLVEYKSSLITAAVTGELDVTTTGSSIPG